MSKTIKKSTVVFSVLALITLFIFVTAQYNKVYATETVASGTCGENVDWTLDDDGVLTISGHGAIDSYTDYRYLDYNEEPNNPPWFDQKNSIKTIIIQDGVVTIGAYAFFDLGNLTAVQLPDSLEVISAEAFYQCTALPEIQIPDSVRLIGNGAFWNCSSLKSFTFPKSLKKISRHVIEATAITDLFIPKNITEIEAESIWNCASLTSITVAEDNPNYSSYDSCLYNKNKSQLIVCPAQKESVLLSPDVNTLGMSAYGGRFSAFYGCTKLAKVEFDENWNGKTIGYSWFSGLSSLKDIDIPEGVTTIDYMAFAGCSLENVTLPSTVTSLGRSCFGGMSSLKTLSIPASVTSINFAALDGSRPIIICEKESVAEEFAVNYGYNYRIYQIEATNATYTGNPIEPEVTVKEPNSGTELVAGTDYELTYQNNVNAGKATLKIACVGRFEGAAVAAFNIKPASADKLSVALSPTSYTYDGKTKTPVVTVKKGTETLKKDTDYTISYASGRKNAGTYKVSVNMKGNYTGVISKSFTIKQANNPLTIKAKTATVKYSKVKKKAQTLAVTKVITFAKTGQGTMTYTKASGNKKITIAKKTGKVTVKKGLKKGTYKVKVKVKAAGNTNYKASSVKTVTFKVKIK